MESKQTNFNFDARGALSYSLNRATTELFKEFLKILEENRSRHIEGLNKLSDHLPQEYQKYIELADWLSEEEEDRQRAKVLRHGNDTIRKIKEEIDKYIIELK